MSKQSEIAQANNCNAARRNSKQVFWTNASVNAISGDKDLISVTTKKTGDLVFKAKDDGWSKINHDSTNDLKRSRTMVLRSNRTRKDSYE